MRTETPGYRSVNAFRIDLLFNFMDLAIACCKSATLCLDEYVPETMLASAKKSYGSALRLAGRLSFNAQQVAEFEGRSIRLETLISQLRTRKGGALRVEQTLRRSKPSASDELLQAAPPLFPPSAVILPIE